MQMQEGKPAKPVRKRLVIKKTQPVMKALVSKQA
jgi:hypothetical protein